MKKPVIIALFFLSGLAGLLLSWYQHREINSTQEDFSRQTFHYPAQLAAQWVGDKEAGKKIFHEFCASCHAKNPLIDIAAPRIDDKKAWDMRRRLGMGALLAITIQGVGAMPARGGCFECSDTQLREAIQYMLDSEKGAKNAR